MKISNSIITQLKEKITKKSFFVSSIQSVDFSTKYFDIFFNYYNFLEGDIRIFKNGNPIHNDYYNSPKTLGNFCHRVVNKKQVLNYFNQGATIIFEALNEKDKFFQNISSEITKITNKRCWINGYLTPKKSCGFPYHIDEHNVIVIQLLGNKKWKFQSDVTENEILISNNDLLYIPQGLPHCAETSESFSFHISIGFSFEEKKNNDFINLLEFQYQLENLDYNNIYYFTENIKYSIANDDLTIYTKQKEINLPKWSASFIDEIISKNKIDLSNSNSLIDKEFKYEIIYLLFKNKLINTVPNNV